MKRYVDCIVASSFMMTSYAGASTGDTAGSPGGSSGGGALLVIAFVGLMYLVVSLLRAAGGARDVVDEPESGMDFDKRTRSLSDPMGDRT